MTVIRRRTLLWRWPLVTFIVFALFWGIWYFVAGSVPATESVKLTITESWTLPFAVSRWWDLLFGPAYVLAILVFRHPEVQKDDEFVIGLGLGFMFGAMFGLGFGLMFGVMFGLGLGLVIGLGLGLVFGAMFGLGFGLGFGLVFGAMLGLGFGFGIGLWVGIIWLVTKSFSREFWNWLTANPEFVVVVQDVRDGEHGLYAIVNAPAKLRIEGSITFSISKSVWNQDRSPEKGEKVIIGDITEKPAGYRANRARPKKPA